MRGDLSFHSEVPGVYTDLATLGPKGPAVTFQLSGHGGGVTTTDFRLVTGSGVIFWEALAVPNSQLLEVVVPAGWTIEAKASAPGVTTNARATGKDYNWSEEG